MSSKIPKMRSPARSSEATRESRRDGPEPSKPLGCLLYVSHQSRTEPAQTLRVGTAAVTIGRGAECDLVLDDENVSRHHARLEVERGGIRVEDLGSTNGIRYLDKRIERATLSLGSRIAISSYHIDLLPLPGVQAIAVSQRERYGDLVGTSLPMRQLYSTLEALEQSDAPVLIQGETGTGKELVARALHQQGQRAHKPLVVIDCGSVPVELMESELFGHCAGAYTGAVAKRAGAFEEADGGTVFLDELGELPLSLQPKLLRVLEAGQVKRLGETAYRSVNTRIVTATQRNLAKDVEMGLFREDLYYRVAVVELQLPPLRERLEDVPVLVNALLPKLSEGEVTLPPELIEQLMQHHWPGNVRELRNVLQRSLALPTGPVVTPQARQAAPATAAPVPGEPANPGGRVAAPAPAATTGPGPLHLGLEIPGDLGFREARVEVLRAFERAYLTRLWAAADGNLSAAARSAGIHRKYLRDLLNRHGLG